MAAQELVFPGSSYLKRGTYDPEMQMLTVEFVNGGACQHRGVPQQVVDWLQSEGGSYYRQKIYGRYGAVSI